MRAALAFIQVALLAVTVALPFSQDQTQCEPADGCTDAKCKLPACFCSGNETVISPDATDDNKPQIIYLTFDDALSKLASDNFYMELFGTPTNSTYKNPNGCGIRATHFVTHAYTDYSLVNKWWHYGHEIASHSVTHRTDQKYWEHMTTDQYEKEIVGQRRLLGQFAAIDPCEVKGWRSPFLQMGGDPMYELLQKENFSYDCTWPTRSFGYVNAVQGLYPYTMDYKSAQDCPIAPCPNCAHPGLWVQPMIDLEDEWIGANPMYPHNGNPCSMLDACTIFKHDDYVDNDPEQVYHMLMKNFIRIYHGENETGTGDFIKGNKAPWGLYMHAAWFFGGEDGNGWHYEGYKKFIKEITDNVKYPDVWIVPVEAGIAYMESDIGGFSMSNADLMANGKANGPFACEDIENQTGKYDRSKNRCGPAKTCLFPSVNLPDDGIIDSERYLTICSYNSNGERQNCPNEKYYPWLEGAYPEMPDMNACSGNQPCKNCEP